MSLNKEKLQLKFFEEYNRLNEKQKQAVNTIEGPVMVIAGPGTGKTQILASRIGKILLETDALPENILCLTYTDAGVVAMRKRLLNFIGPDAYKVNIYTYHAFCNDVIQDNLSQFEKTALDPISDLEKIELFKELIDSFPKTNPLKRYRGDVYFEINNLDKLFSTMKKEGWAPEFILSKIDDYIKDLPLRDEFVYKKKYKQFNAGDIKKEKLEEETERMERLRAAVKEFDRFQQMMRKHNRYDFDDMITWVIKAFEENKNLLANYQELYQYVLVDEFQDSSGTQNKIVELLISYWDKPNVFVVGDDDQSIFRFQGANVENMEQFRKSYQGDLFTVVLTNNYRSTQSILDVSKAVINRNEDRLIKKIEGLSKDLTASSEKIKHITHVPLIKIYETQREEMIDITLQIQKLLREGIPAGKIAVIYKENRYGEELAKYFNHTGVPFYSKRHLNTFEIPLAQKIILIFKYLAYEHDKPYGGDELLFEILHLTWFGIPAIEIAKLSVEVASKQFSEHKTSLRKLLSEKTNAPAKDLFSQTIHPGLQLASNLLEKLIADVPNITLQHLFENIIREGGILKYIMLSKEKHWLLKVLTGLFDFVKEETRRNPVLTLKQFVSIVELMEKEDIPLPLVQVSGSEKGVNLLTVHGSKGLEFEYVFFPGCNSASWEKKRVNRQGYKLPDNLFATSSDTKESSQEELRRLFYVALTRAEGYLTLSYSRFKNDGKDLEPSMFLAEIEEELPLVKEQIILTTEVLSEFTALLFSDSLAPEIEKIEESFIQPLLEKFVMNVTALNNYLSCPLEFYFKNLIRIPSPKNEATEFGSSVHYALEQLFKKMKESGTNTFHSKEQFILDFEWYMDRHRESFTKEQFNRRLEYGRDVLSNYYDERINSFNRIVVIENTIRNVMINGVPIKGKLDKMEFDGKLVNVVDYKTGDIDNAKDKLKGPDDKQPNGGDYWRQAVFYKLLVDHYQQKDWKVVSTEFDFIEPDKKKKEYHKVKLIITEPDLETVRQQISSVWEKIQNREFYIGCGKEDCHWCNFVNTNEMTIALHELNNEEESV